jgi:hypothetical protein
MKGLFTFALPAALVTGMGVLVVRTNLCKGRLQHDLLFLQDVKDRPDTENQRCASRVAAHIEQQREWLRLSWQDKLLTPVPQSWVRGVYLPMVRTSEERHVY